MCGTGAVVMVMLPVTPHVHESVDGAVVGVDSLGAFGPSSPDLLSFCGGSLIALLVLA